VLPVGPLYDLFALSTFPCTWLEVIDAEGKREDAIVARSVVFCTVGTVASTSQCQVKAQFIQAYRTIGTLIHGKVGMSRPRIHSTAYCYRLTSYVCLFARAEVTLRSSRVNAETWVEADDTYVETPVYC
jgi:hypothetical protein